MNFLPVTTFNDVEIDISNNSKRWQAPRGGAETANPVEKM